MAPSKPQRAQAKPQAGAANYVIWGSLAVCAVLVTAGLVTLSITGRSPFNVAQITTTRPPAQPVIQKPQGVPEFEMARLQDALRAMAAEREQLSTRIEQLERSVGDITASINTVKERTAPPQITPPKTAATPPPEAAALPTAPPVAPPAAPPPMIAAIPPSPPPAAETAILPSPPASAPVADSPRGPAPPPLGAPSRPGQISARPPAARSIQIAPKPSVATRPPVQVLAPPKPATTTQVSQIMPAPVATDSVVTKTEFGVDLGGETSMDGLRALWANVKGNHGTMLDGMRPLVSVREGPKPGTVELRLIAGPVPNAGAAARVCANLQTTGVACQAAEYDGQRLSLR